MEYIDINRLSGLLDKFSVTALTLTATQLLTFTLTLTGTFCLALLVFSKAFVLTLVLLVFIALSAILLITNDRQRRRLSAVVKRATFDVPTTSDDEGTGDGVVHVWGVGVPKSSLSPPRKIDANKVRAFREQRRRNAESKKPVDVSTND